jgi:hypothetical protein
VECEGEQNNKREWTKTDENMNKISVSAKSRQAKARQNKRQDKAGEGELWKVETN